MKTFALIILFALGLRDPAFVAKSITLSGPVGPVLVQQKTGTVAAGNLTINFDAPITAGHSIVICVTSLFGVDHVSAESGADSNFTAESLSAGTGVQTEIWFLAASSVVGGGTDVVISRLVDGRMNANISEWSGLNDAASENAKQNSASVSSTVIADGGVSSSSNNLTVAVGGWTADDYSSGPINSFTRMTAIGGGAVWQETAYRIQLGSTDPQGSGWTLTAGINWAAATAVFGAP